MKKIFMVLSLFKPSNIQKLVTHAYLLTKPKEFKRTLILNEIIKARKYARILEVGVYDAQNLFGLANSNPSCHFYGVDPYFHKAYGNNEKNDGKQKLLLQNAEDIYKEVFKNAQILKNVTIIRKESLEATNDFASNSLDLVFIDAIHTYISCKRDIEEWLPKIKKGGLLCGHDYNIQFFGVIQAVNEILGVDNIYIKSDSTWFYEVN